MESSPKHHPRGSNGPEQGGAPQRPATPPGQAGVPEQRTAPRIPSPPHPVSGGPPGTRPDPGPLPPNVPRPVRRWSRARLVLAVLGGVLALFCLGGLGLGLVLYNEATEPDRSTPDVAADNYLRALLVERDATRAEVFACDDGAALAPLHAFLEETERRERDLGAAITVNLEDMRVGHETEDAASVSVVVRRTAVVDGARQSLADQWEVQLRNADGWRVCGANRRP